MTVNSNQYIPQVYGKERTIQVFTKLLDIILSICKYEIDNIGDLYDPFRCPEHLLPSFAKTLNYDYNYNDTVISNRRVIDAFTTMEKYRGSKKGILMAMALSLTSSIVSQDNAQLFDEEDYMNALKELNIVIDYEKAEIIIEYPNIYTVVRYLLDYVRPVGMTATLLSVCGQTFNADTMLVYADTENRVQEYEPKKDSFVNSSAVNFSNVGDETWKKILQGLDIDTMNFNQ